MNRTFIFLVFLTATLMPLHSARADIKSSAVRKTTEFVMKRFGREAAEQGAEVLTRKIGNLASRFGDDALMACRKVGPKVARFADDAGEHAPLAMRLLAGHGDDAVRVVTRPKQLGLVARFGDDAAETLMKHGEVAEPLLHTIGAPAAKALRGISTQNGRRVSMMVADGQLAKLGRSDELLGVIAKFGDAGAEFVWKHKGALTVGTGLAAFLAAPDSFITGGKDIASIAADAAIKPVVTAAAESTPWFALASLLGLAGGLFGGWKLWAWRVSAAKRL